MPKKIVYLFGAGATQAVLKEINIEYSLMTEDIKAFMLSSGKLKLQTEIETQLQINPDVEHLISVLESQYNHSVSEKLRNSYRDAIVSLSKCVSRSLPATLYTVLCDLHLNTRLKEEEELTCFITLNYEDILERSIEKHLKHKVNYVLETNNETSGEVTIVDVLKLHGSFSWTNNRPIRVQRMSSIKSGGNLWIPPGVDKKKENYPFNLLWGKATDFLFECDVLRVVGCSLSRNDWSLIPIVYTAQKFLNHKSLDIEIIDYSDTAKKITNNYNYLSLKSIVELDEMTSHYKRLFPKSRKNERTKEMESNFVFSPNSPFNPFSTWLLAKIGQLIETKGINSIDKKVSKFVYNFYHKL